MAGLFAILLTLATLITGIFWCLEKFKWQPARQSQVEAVRKETDGEIDGKILAEIGKPKRWIENIASFFPVLLLVFVVRSFLIEPFQIPSGSMMQTLLIGDFIGVQKYSYGLRDPITNTVIIPTGTPQRGDVAVFKHPQLPQMDLIKRVIGLPGDKIIYLVDKKQLIIYPACQKNEPNCTGQQAQPLDLHYGQLEESNWKEVYQKYKNHPLFFTRDQYSKDHISDSNDLVTLNMKIREETLGTHKHNILVTDGTNENSSNYYHQPNQEIATWVVPQGHYFMMGDNRDNSGDSRYFGFVPERNFVGKATFIWISFDKQPDEWPTGIRFNQIGKIK